MLMNQGLSETSMITTAHARVEWTTSGPRHLYLLYDQAHYMELSTPDGWWHRALALDPYHRFHLSGTADTSPWEAIQAILREPNRPAFTLPALLVALFLARAAQPDSLEQRHLFRWVAFALPHLQVRLPAGSLQAGWEELSIETLDACLHTIINALLENQPVVPWVLPDGAWLHVLDHLGDSLWHFPAYATRVIGADAAGQFNLHVGADEEVKTLNRHTSHLPPSTVIGYLSALRFWREPWPTIRGVSIGTSMLEFLPLWHQALFIMDPDAPAISETDWSWLCDRTLGSPSDGPFDHLLSDHEEHDVWGHSITNWQKRITTLRQEATRGTRRPSGCWEVQCDAHWPVFSAYQVARIRVVAGPQGCWVRLIPAGESWGSVFWWWPKPRPLMWLSLALGEASTSIPVLVFHTTLWQLWRDLRVVGHPVGQSLHINSGKGIE